MLKNMLQQAMRFVVTGGINTAFSYGIYALCIFLGAGYAIASGVSITCGVLFSYKTTSAVVFGRGYSGSLVRYIGSYVIVYLFSVLILKTMDEFGINAYLAGVLAAPPCAVLSFALLKLFVFHAGHRGPVDRHSGL
jgi:putative flippase GtrA